VSAELGIDADDRVEIARAEPAHVSRVTRDGLHDA
jgi:hypothetical protein